MSIPVRLWFKKHSSAIYISHLDMNRTMIRVIRRAQIPVWYTEGFNRHAYITFPSPMPLFVTGLREPLDFKLDGSMKLCEVIRRMNEVCPEGIEIVDAALPQMKACDIANARYEIKVLFENKDAQQSLELLSTAKQADSITIMKKTKRGQKEVELKQYIENTAFEYTPDGAAFNLILPSGNDLNISPFLLLDAICAKYDTAIDQFEITRTELYNKDMQPFK